MDVLSALEDLYPHDAVASVSSPRLSHTPKVRYIFLTAFIMGVASLLELLFLLTAYLSTGATSLTLPLNQAYGRPVSPTTPLLNSSDLMVAEKCTSSPLWTGDWDYSRDFTYYCFQAYKTFLRKDADRYSGIEFEFLRPGAASFFTNLPKMATPRRYVKGESTIHLECRVIPLTMRCPGSCTIAIVNIVDIPRGILPAQSSEPVPRSDAGQLSDFRIPMMGLRGQCVGEEKQAGWAVAGK